MLKADAEFLRMIYDFFVHGTKLTYAAMGVGLFIAVLYFPIFFKGASGFKEDIKNETKSPFLNKDYDYVDVQWSKDKIALWIIISVGCGLLAYYQLPGWFPNFFSK